MPRSPGWLTSLPDAIEQLEGLQRDTVTRRDIEDLLGVSKRRAVILMHQFGAHQLGNALALERQRLIRTFIRAWRRL